MPNFWIEWGWRWSSYLLCEVSLANSAWLSYEGSALGYRPHAKVPVFSHIWLKLQKALICPDYDWWKTLDQIPTYQHWWLFKPSERPITCHWGRRLPERKAESEECWDWDQSCWDCHQWFVSRPQENPPRTRGGIFPRQKCKVISPKRAMSWNREETTVSDEHSCTFCVCLTIFIIDSFCWVEPEWTEQHQDRVWQSQVLTSLTQDTFEESWEILQSI